MKKFHILALAAVTAGLLAVPAGASADTGECVFEGVAGNISPGVVLVGGSGTYEFATTNPATTQCRQNGGSFQNSSIESRGSFSNTVCGTGTADGNNANFETTIDLGADDPNPADREIFQADYLINFTAGASGRLDISQVNNRPEQRLHGSAPADVDGNVSIVPTEGSCSTAVTAFEVAGAFTATW